MKHSLLAILVAAAGVAGCSSGAPADQRMTESEFETKIASAISFDPALLKVGDRVVYFVKRTGETTTQKYSWSAVAEDKGAVWVENSVPFNVSRMVVKTKLERSGKMLEQWVGEPGGVPGQTYPSPKSGDAPKHVRDSASAKADEKQDIDRVTVGGKTYECTRVTTVLAYPDGRKSTMTNWFSKEVPFAPNPALGGLVKRQFGRLSMELIIGDRNAKAEMQIPSQK
jgi:hypothetical protein